MNTFKSSGPGGLRGRDDRFGGRPASDADYGKKKSFGKKPGAGGKGGFDKRGRGERPGGFKGGDRGGFGGARDGGRREVSMHKATCSTCGKPCEVPFRPDGSKPVLCSECFGKAKSDDRGGFERRDRFSNDRPARAHATQDTTRSDEQYALLVKQIAVLEEKLNEVIALIEASVIVADEMAEEITEKTKSPKAAAKKSAAKKAVKKVAKKVVKKVAKKTTKK
jgi:CxxC-x17-CxxC domain-containing protein